MSNLTKSSIAWSSFKFFGRSHVGLTLGIAAATAVIVGALAVGDSVRGSLKHLVLTRLANVELLLRSRNYFQPELVAGIKTKSPDHLAPFILLANSSIESASDQQVRRASRVQILAIDDRFIGGLSQSNRDRFPSAPAADEVIINDSLAKELGVQVGDQLTLIMSENSGVPADSPLGKRELDSKILPRQKIVSIVSDEGIGAFSFQSSQEAPLNVFASLPTVQEFLEVGQGCNAAVVMADHPSTSPSREIANFAQEINDQLQPTLEDLGLQLSRHRRTFPDETLAEPSEQPQQTIYDYFQISSKDLLIDKVSETALVESLGAENCNLTLAYLVNAIQKADPIKNDSIEQSLAPRPTIIGRLENLSVLFSTRQPMYRTVGRVVPYSIVVGMSQGLDQQLDILKPTPYDNRTGSCAVNSWLAQQLELSQNDRIQLEFYEPETTDGQPIKTYIGMQVDAIVPIVEPVAAYRRNQTAKFDRPPSVYNDPHLTPTVPGVTDQQSIANWDVPFELEHRDLILKQDDVYWDSHRLTPKILLPLAQAQQLFGSRFGNITSIRVPITKFEDEATLRQRLQPALDSLAASRGLVFQPIRQQQLLASSGTTPFDMLFFSLSFFVILAAFMLVAILFRLSIQQRSSQLGVLFTQGFTLPAVRRIIMCEFAIVALLGAILGIPLGLSYARLMIAGLESWWIGAISTSFLRFDFSAASLVAGALSGSAISLTTIYFSLRRVSGVQPLHLLRGRDGDDSGLTFQRSIAGWAPAVVLMLGALLLAGWATGQSGMVRAGCFFGSGLLLLIGMWLTVRYWLMRGQFVRISSDSIWNLALGAIRRNPLRSSLSIGLLAVASFLIASMGVFHMSPTELGSGGFDLVGISSQPIYTNMGSAAARREAIGPAADALLGSVVIPLRMREGDDASCTNLFQPNSPTILGMPPIIQRLSESTTGYQFAWAGVLNPRAPWEELQYKATGDSDMPIPVVLDLNTAMWSLKQGGKLGAKMVIDVDGKPIHFVVVGLLNNSLLQGKLIISEKNFQALFPKINGSRYFLISTRDCKTEPEQVISTMESGWSSAGLDLTSSQELLLRLLAVQNTYISAFQSLGALGLLLGTIGLMAVQLRSVWERRSELALMQALGFSKSRIGNLLTAETILLLGTGMLIGVVCSTIALVPFILEVGPQLSLLQPLILLAIVFGCGLLVAFVAIRMALKLPLLASLRNQ
jgi:putative ABC transport system permease protein